MKTSVTKLFAVCTFSVTVWMLADTSQATTVTLSANRDGLMLASPEEPSNNNNFGANPFFQTGRSLGDPTRSLVGFSTAPLVGVFMPGDQVSSITLQLVTNANTQGASAKTTQVYAVADGNANWVEGTAIGTVQAGSFSWNSRQQGSLSWLGSAGLSTPGVDYVNTLLSQQTFLTNPAPNQVVNFNFSGSSAALTSLITNWMNVTNAGLLLLDPNQGTLTDNIDRLTYHSKEATTVNFRPTLIVTFASVPPVPEPSTCLLLGLGLLVFKGCTRRQRQAV